MNYRMTTRIERPRQQAVAYLMHALIFIALAFISQQPWIIMLCAFLSCVAGFKAATLLSNAIFHRDVFMADEFAHRIEAPGMNRLSKE